MSARDLFHEAVKQALQKDQWTIEANEPSRTLYLAVPLDVYQTFFQLEFTQTAVQRYQILLVVYNPVNEEIVKWIK